MCIKVIKQLLHESYRVKFDEFRLHEERKKSLHILENEHRQCFKMIHTRANMILSTNPRSRVIIRTRKLSFTFERMYFCSDAERLGFWFGCYPFIGINRTQLKIHFRCCLFTDMTFDENDSYFLSQLDCVKVRLKKVICYFQKI